MTIREVINVLIDAPDKDKPFIVECRRDALKNHEYKWGQLEITQIVNCTHSSVAEAEYEGRVDSCKPIESGRIPASSKLYEFNITKTSLCGEDEIVAKVYLSTIEDLLALQKHCGNEELILLKQEQGKMLTLEIYDTWRE